MFKSNRRAVGFSWWQQRDNLQRTEAGRKRERCLDFPSDMDENVEPRGIAPAPLGVKAEPGPRM
jgi:hypothetical protein